MLERPDRKAAFSRIASRAEAPVAAREPDQCGEIAENEALGLHEANFARAV